MKKTTDLFQKALSVCKEIIDILEKLGYFEIIYGYVDGRACNIVAIADDVPREKRDVVWGINGDYQKSNFDLDIEIRIIMRRGKPLANIYHDDGSAVIVREIAAA